MRINYSRGIHIHRETKYIFQTLLNKDSKFLGCLKACITLNLSIFFFNLLSFTLFNSELAVTEILFES